MQLEICAWQILIVDVAFLAQCRVAVVREGWNVISCWAPRYNAQYGVLYPSPRYYSA